VRIELCSDDGLQINLIAVDEHVCTRTDGTPLMAKVHNDILVKEPRVPVVKEPGELTEVGRDGVIGQSEKIVEGSPPR
jgi:hypothetical protein